MFISFNTHSYSHTKKRERERDWGENMFLTQLRDSTFKNNSLLPSGTSFLTEMKIKFYQCATRSHVSRLLTVCSFYPNSMIFLILHVALFPISSNITFFAILVALISNLWVLGMFILINFS